MMLSGIAVIVVPMAMTRMHSGHSEHGSHSEHSSHVQMNHSSLTPNLNDSSSSNTGTMNHDMSMDDPTVDHSTMNHSTQDMTKDAAPMQMEHDH